jgi:hypothetical protein
VSPHRAVCATPVERQRVPAIGVVTSCFVSAAELMCRVFGMPDYKFAVIGI